MNDKKLDYYVTKYFKEYLPSITGVSINTINSYKDTFVLLLEYLRKQKKIDINNLQLDDINSEIVENFLVYLENERNNSISTRNQRLAAIHSFYKFLQRKELSCFDLCSNILSIPKKKAPTSTISYFSLSETEILINKPNTKLKSGFRDYALLLFMYETAARASEIVNLTRKQVFLTQQQPYVILFGKGNKERMVPISNNLSDTLSKYFSVFKISSYEDFVFYNNKKEKLTTKGIEYILKKYIELAKIDNPDKFRKSYSNHSMRHTRAMHLLEAGVNLIYIRDILGHKSIITTEIYAKTSAVVKNEQIIKHSKSLNVKSKYKETEKDTLLDFLKEKNNKIMRSKISLNP